MNKDNLKNRILSEISSGRVSMRPRAYFVLQVLALIFVALAAWAVTVFIFNFIVFSIRINHQDQLLNFGFSGWGAFLAFFPWTLLSLDVLLVLLLQWLVRKFSWGYKVPTLYLLGALFALTFLTGAVIDRGTPLNDQLWRAQRHLPPPFDRVYRAARHHDIDDALRGFGIPLPPDAEDVPTSTGPAVLK